MSEPIEATIALPTPPSATLIQSTPPEVIRIPADFSVAFFVVVGAILLAIALAFRRYAGEEPAPPPYPPPLD